MSTQKIIVQKKQKIKKGNYILGETIGEGAFAKVKLATHIFTGEKVAIKILDKQVLEADAQNQNIQNDSSFLNDMQRIKKEIKILKELRHKNIIQLYEIMESENKLYIVMEYCEGKELFDYIVKRKHLTEKEACRFFQQIINGVEYLHLNNITHRDLKPENLLLTNKKRIKISDFGLSTKTSSYYQFLTTPCGTPSYAPPEMLRGDEYSGIYSDIWSCGIILYTMLVGNLPCAESKEYLIYECIIKHNYEYPSYLSDAVKDLLEKILKVNPQERIGFEQIKKHPWFNIINPRLRPGIILDVHKIPIDDNILNVVKNYDYKIEDVKYSVENSLYDDKTTIYYLILKQFIKEGKNSNSDLFSSDYLNFIKNLDNWIKPEKVNDDKFKEYRKWVDLKQTNKLFKPKKIDNNSVNLSTNNNKNNSINNIKSSNVRRTLNSMSFSNNNNNNNNIKLDRKNRIENYSQRTRMLNDQHRRLFKSEGVIHKPNTARNSITVNNKVNSNLLKSRNNIMKLNKEINNEHNRTFVLSSKPDRQSLNNNMNKTFYSIKKPFYNKLKKTKQKSLFVSFNEPVDSKTKESLLEDIEKNEKNFNDFYKKLENTTNNPNENIVKLLAERLISSTIFSKYLLTQKTIISSPKKTIINHDIEKNIFSIQKYKDLIEDVKIKHIGLFRKKLYTFNSYTFSQYLNEEDDLILNENFIKQYHLSDFVNNLKFSIKRDEKQNLHQRLFSPSSNLNQSLNLNNSLLSSSRNSLGFSSRRILSPNSSMLSNTTFNRKNYSKLNSLKSNISKMEGISEDEDSFEEEKNNNEKTTLRKNTTGSGSLKNKGKVGFNNNIRTINKISAFSPDDNNSKKQKKPSKSMKKKSRNDKNLIMLNDSSIQNLNKTSGSTSIFSLSSKDKFSIKDEIERNEPINLSCIFDLQIIDIINKIKEYSKNNSAYCNVKGNQLRLNKANISIIIIIDKVLINDGFFLYLKIRSKSKNNEKQSLKLINDLLIYLQ